jgi:hypothetical protein
MLCLKEALAGAGKTLMFVNVNPTEDNASETVCSLSFASRGRGVELGAARKNVVADSGGTSEAIKELKAVVGALQEQVTWTARTLYAADCMNFLRKVPGALLCKFKAVPEGFCQPGARCHFTQREGPDTWAAASLVWADGLVNSRTMSVPAVPRWPAWRPRSACCLSSWQPAASRWSTCRSSWPGTARPPAAITAGARLPRLAPCLLARLGVPCPMTGPLAALALAWSSCGLPARLSQRASPHGPPVAMHSTGIRGWATHASSCGASSQPPGSCSLRRCSVPDRRATAAIAMTACTWGADLGPHRLGSGRRRLWCPGCSCRRGLQRSRLRPRYANERKQQSPPPGRQCACISCPAAKSSCLVSTLNKFTAGPSC